MIDQNYYQQIWRTGHESGIHWAVRQLGFPFEKFKELRDEWELQLRRPLESPYPRRKPRRVK